LNKVGRPSRGTSFSGVCSSYIQSFIRSFIGHSLRFFPLLCKGGARLESRVFNTTVWLLGARWEAANSFGRSLRPKPRINVQASWRAESCSPVVVSLHVNECSYCFPLWFVSGCVRLWKLAKKRCKHGTIKNCSPKHREKGQFLVHLLLLRAVGWQIVLQRLPFGSFAVL